MANPSRWLGVLRTVRWAVAASITAGCAVPKEAPPARPTLDLCAVIADADDYDGKRVQVRAFATVGYEHAFLFSTACEGDDKRVWFQVSTDGDDDARDRSVRSLRRAFRHRNPSELVVYGRFEAPPKYTPRPGTPPGIAKLEKGSLGYGHMSAYRFRFTIERVVEERR